MNDFFSFLHGYAVKKRLRIFALVFLFFTTILFPFSACSKEIDYFSYISELRDNVFLAKSQEYSLRVYSVLKEQPYVADGIKNEVSYRAEFYLFAPSGKKEYSLSFTANGETIQGDMSFDNVKGEYYYFCSLDISNLEEIECVFSSENEHFSLVAKTVKTPNTLDSKSILNCVLQSQTELFSSLTDDYGFAGEIYLRLLYEDSPYYYVGVMDRKANVTAFLLNGETGKILAKRNT